MAIRTTYELPTSARIKSFLSFEQSFRRLDALRTDECALHMHSVLPLLFELEHVVKRSNLNRELVKEIKRQIEAMERLGLSPNVDQELLGNIIAQQGQLIEALRESPTDVEKALKENELLSHQRRRQGPTANNNLDLDAAAYQHLLARPVDEQRAALTGWMRAYSRHQQAVDMVLSLIRSSADFVDELAYQGYFESKLPKDKSCQLLRIGLPPGSQYYPEISKGRSKFRVRFLEPTELYEHTMQVEDDVEFRLALCAI